MRTYLTFSSIIVVLLLLWVVVLLLLLLLLAIFHGIILGLIILVEVVRVAILIVIAVVFLLPLLVILLLLVVAILLLLVVKSLLLSISCCSIVLLVIRLLLLLRPIISTSVTRRDVSLSLILSWHLTSWLFVNRAHGFTLHEHWVKVFFGLSCSLLLRSRCTMLVILLGHILSCIRALILRRWLLCFRLFVGIVFIHLYS